MPPEGSASQRRQALLHLRIHPGTATAQQFHQTCAPAGRRQVQGGRSADAEPSACCRYPARVGPRCAEGSRRADVAEEYRKMQRGQSAHAPARKRLRSITALFGMRSDSPIEVNRCRGQPLQHASVSEDGGCMHGRHASGKVQRAGAQALHHLDVAHATSEQHRCSAVASDGMLVSSGSTQPRNDVDMPCTRGEAQGRHLVAARAIYVRPLLA
mmetsp:Transcript_4032/g.11482  ORF Transcript_4032/g.11482 Transcript_4032/m.11482 type:complete len:213 (-) Transcript_4032:651-1289(-)